MTNLSTIFICLFLALKLDLKERVRLKTPHLIHDSYKPMISIIQITQLHSYSCHLYDVCYRYSRFMPTVLQKC